MTFVVYTLGGGPVAHAHIVYIELSDKLHDLGIHDLSGRRGGELLSSDSDQAIGGRVLVECAVPRRHSGISLLWMLATGPIADIYAIDSLRLASVWPTGLTPPPGRV